LLFLYYSNGYSYIIYNLTHGDYSLLIVIPVIYIFTYGDLFEKENLIFLNFSKYLSFITFIVLKYNYFYTYV